MLNALSIDVEEWFHVTSFEARIGADQWERLESRVEEGTTRILDILDEYQAQATFFILGWVSERHPELIRHISERGHEIAAHGYSHQLVFKLTQKEFKEEAQRTKDLLQGFAGKEVMGYRAPSWSITEDTPWAFDILEKLGFRYDSSVIPGRFRHGNHSTQVLPYNVSKKGVFLEFPLSCYHILGFSVPFSGGFFLRLLPYFMIRAGIKRFNLLGRPALVYLHSWEMDVGHPRLKVSRTARMVHYYNLESTERKLRSLLGDFQFSTLGYVLSTISAEDLRCKL